MALFGVFGLEKLQTCRGIEKEILDFDDCTGGCANRSAA
jgi:hypothetical protein